ncbi:MAG: endonuclease, partial [Chitinophagaceae bacterium]|nr:endonuclease [Chitinophagaceae bacterium]
MNKIPKESIPIAYEIAKEVFNKNISHTTGIEKIVTLTKMKRSSAKDYIYDYNKLMNGYVSKRTINTASFEYYFASILDEYGYNGLINPIKALKKHITYYEYANKSNAKSLRKILLKYTQNLGSPVIVSTQDQLLKNISTLENYLIDGSSFEVKKAQNLIQNGICFIAYRIGHEQRFAPSRFLGYENNDFFQHMNSDIDGRETNIAISKIIGNEPCINDAQEKKYIKFCSNLGIEIRSNGSYGTKRKFWILPLVEDFNQNILIPGDFPEGKLVERK